MNGRSAGIVGAIALFVVAVVGAMAFTPQPAGREAR